jgi:SRSO17 transposase
MGCLPDCALADGGLDRGQRHRPGRRSAHAAARAGEHTAGVKRQYLGCAGRVANGINVVYATYAAPAGHAVIAARLYVPADWAGDRDRRRAAGIPGELTFATKPALAAEIIEDLLAGGAAHRG